MNVPVFLHGSLANHRRGQILKEAITAKTITSLPVTGSIVLEFGEAFQVADQHERAQLIEWTRSPGHVLLLLPPFTKESCHSPVTWQATRHNNAPQGGEGLAKHLASEVCYQLTGKLQPPTFPGASWSDNSASVGVYRLHPSSGLFAVTTLPLWSLSVLDRPDELNDWLCNLALLAGESNTEEVNEAEPLTPEHYGFLVFLMSTSCREEEGVIDEMQSSPIFQISEPRSRSLLKDLQNRALVDGTDPTAEARELIMQSPYGHYVSALREVNQP